MTDSFVRVPPDSTGKKVQTLEVVDGDGNTVERQVVVIGDPATEGSRVGVTAAGRLEVDAIGSFTTAAPVQLVKLDYDVRSDSSPVYLGRAAPGTADSDATWAVQKFTYDSQGRVIVIENATGAWSNRGSLPYS